MAVAAGPGGLFPVIQAKEEDTVEPQGQKLTRFLVAVLLGAIAGAVGGAVLKGTGWLPPKSVAGDTEPEPAAAEALPQEVRPVPADYESPAVAYARAMQQGHWDRVISMTLWMRDRLDYVRETEGDAAILAARQDLAAQLADRDTAGNRVTREGVEDQYVFVPGAELRVLAVDEGRDDLAAPAAERVWMTAVFPNRARAPRDAMGLPIKRLTVGVNVSTEGYILKAAIIGNLEIAWDAVSYDW